MEIQKIIFPREDICNEWKMYFRCGLPENFEAGIDERNRDENVRARAVAEGQKAEPGAVLYPYDGAEAVFLKKGEELSLQTYFNSFSIGKWSEYTTLDNVSLQLLIDGDAEIHAYHEVGHLGEHAQNMQGDTAMYESLTTETTCIDGEVEITRGSDAEEDDAEEHGAEEHGAEEHGADKNSVDKTGKMYTVSFKRVYKEGILYTVIKANTDLVIYGGAWCTDTKPEREADLALGICTFRREAFVTANVKKVLRDIITNETSPLYGHLEVYISDNGQTLTMSDFTEADTDADAGTIHLFPNMNAGGAGGFTRTMIEALIRREHSPFTHIILMDDDIVLDCRVLERTYYFLRYIKPEHRDMMVGGHMFELGHRAQLFEAGARFGGIEVRFFDKNWDMRFAETTACAAVDNPINYSGWWYSVIPASIINEHNLPISLFIHYDDIEYGIRNEKNGTILLNGICVWHPQGAGKAPIAMNYYDVRNMQIANVGRPDQLTAEQLVFHMKNRVIGDVIRYRYEGAERVFEAIEDFYRGPEYVMHIEPLSRHAALSAKNYKFEKPEEAGVDLEQMVCVRDQDIPRWWYIWDACCWLLPPVKEIRISGNDDHGLPFMAKRIYFYDKNREAGFLVERNYRRAWACMKRYFRVRKMVLRDHDRVMREWAGARPDYISLPHWEKYLGMEKEKEC